MSLNHSAPHGEIGSRRRRCKSGEETTERVLDDRFRNSMAIADGACAARSRREEEDDALPSSTTTNEEIARNPRLPNGLRARVRTQTLSCADEHLRYIQFDLWAQQLSCYFGIDHLGCVSLQTPALKLSCTIKGRRSEVRSDDPCPQHCGMPDQSLGTFGLSVDTVVFARESDLQLLASRTQEGFNAKVDPGRKRLLSSGPMPAAASLQVCWISPMKKSR